MNCKASRARQRCHALALLGVALLTGCASVSVQRAEDVSSAGIAYSQATAAVVDAAIDASIDFDSRNRLRTKPTQPVPADAQAQREASLRERDALLTRSTLLYTRMKQSIGATQTYFQGLQQLADGSTAEATETAVKQLADRVNGVNQVLDKSDSGQPLIPDNRRDAVGGLAKLVTQQVHGAKLAKALERDAPVIGRALVLQELVLQAASEDIRANLNNEAARFYVDRVVRPFKSGDIDDAWAEDRKTALKVAALGNTDSVISSAQAAARQMQTVWARILSGEYSAKEMTAMLKETEELLAAANLLKQAKTPK